jgi:hypothetical protein
LSEHDVKTRPNLPAWPAVPPGKMLVLQRVGQRTGKTSLFAQLEDVYPECWPLIAEAPQLAPLSCLFKSCRHMDACMNKLAHRVTATFDAFPKAVFLYLWFTYEDSPSLRAVVFSRADEKGFPKVIVLNPWGWKSVVRDAVRAGETYAWQLPKEIAPTIIGKG